jgi:hypothetical protein
MRHPWPLRSKNSFGELSSRLFTREASSFRAEFSGDGNNSINLNDFVNQPAVFNQVFSLKITRGNTSGATGRLLLVE